VIQFIFFVILLFSSNLYATQDTPIQDPFKKNRVDGRSLPSIVAEPNGPDGKKRLSLQFDNISIRDFLGLLAEFQGVNLIISDAVSGSLNLRLKNVTWRQALNAVLAMKNLEAIEKDDILFVASLAEIQAQKQQEIPEENIVQEAFYVRYADATNLADLIKSNAGFLSDRGSIVSDVRSNILWLKDTPKKLEAIKMFLQKVDNPAKQVRIKAHIVNVDQSSVKELGLKFGTVGQASSNHSGPLHMDMPMSIKDTGRFSMAVAKLGNDVLLNLELSALEKEGRAQMISNPELVTANRQAASIESGQEIPYQESTSNGATHTVFKKAVLSLKVMPVVTPDNKILLTLTVNQDKVSPLVVNGMPAVSTQEIQTQVLVDNGETIVLGGIYEESTSTIHERTPFLASIPVVGILFKSKASNKERRELLIFVQPEMVS
jgi:type IV pilus assembly protein PilQ